MSIVRVKIWDSKVHGFLFPESSGEVWFDSKNVRQPLNGGIRSPSRVTDHQATGRPKNQLIKTAGFPVAGHDLAVEERNWLLRHFLWTSTRRKTIESS
jgi:hypothetical protein